MIARTLKGWKWGRGAGPSSRVHAQDCACRDCRPQWRLGRAALAAALVLAGIVAGIAIIAIADRASGGPGLAVMVGQPGKPS